MSGAIGALRGHYADRTAAARAHKAAGGKVVAYLCDNVPVELIEAAGAFPLRIHGDPSADTGVVRRLVNGLYPPDVTQRPGFVDAMLARVLAGVYDLADAIVVPHNRNAVQAIHRELHDARVEHGVETPPTWYLDKAWAPGEPSRAYNRASVAGLAERLTALTGKVLDDAALADGVAAHDERRRALTSLAALRRQQPSRVPGSLALELIGATWALPGAIGASLLTEAIGELAAAEPVAGPRLYLGGSPHDHPGLYRLVERLGASIVAEDHCWGNRAADLPVASDHDLLGAIGDRFHEFPACSILFPIARTRTAVLARAIEARVDGAIFFVAAGDTTQGWETPGEVAALRDAGIPVLHLRRQPYGAATPALAEAVAVFIASLTR